MLPGTRVQVVGFASEEESFEDLLLAAGSTTDFWDNPLDDEDWNHA